VALADLAFVLRSERLRKTPPPTPRAVQATLGALAIVAIAVAASVWGLSGATFALGLVAVAGLGVQRHTSARWRRRQAALAAPFPEAWRELLLARYDHYDRLSDDLRARFEDDLRLFLAEARITGVGLEVTDELRLLVAASAVTLSLGWPDYEWEQLTEVLLYPDDFDRDYEIGHDELAGQAHPWGSVILSVPALRESFEDPDDAYHVGLHEFAHLLDVEHTHFDGIPGGLDDAHVERYVELREKEMERLRRGKSALDEYGAHDPVEFFAVAVEAFFEAALETRRRHRELYELLAGYFRQDPAAWDDDRGLEL
jgi:Mlc titration factor MtfA (ptsG expression regulator)